jgi:uncharacterized protein YjbI with pentapeptide repeats
MLNEPSEKEKKPAPPGWLIENIAEASKNARKIYLIYVAVLAYCALTVVSTTDRQIILNETARLPLVNLDVSLIGFFIIAPLLTIFVFIYFQLYLNRVNRLILDLRTNYLPVEKRRLYPWLLNFAEDPDPGFTGILQNVIVRFSLWWSLPIVLILFSFWFVKKHDPILSYVIGLTPIFGTLIVLYFWFHYEAVQYKLRPERTKFQRFIGKSVLAYFVIIYEIVLLSLIIPESNKGSVVGVDLSYQKLVTEPDVDYEGLYWANLNGFHLEGANLISTVLKRADLRRAHLQNAYLGGANLQEADLWDANLQEADLSWANLQEADLWDANLQEADLRRANLQEANLSEANLQESDLSWANLQEANLSEANLQEADLGGADLQEASLFEANLQEADLSWADLQEASLFEANLQGAKDLTIGQLSKVKTLYKAQLDPELMGILKKDYPHLFEEPKPKIDK